jgi:hypothetical protein
MANAAFRMAEPNQSMAEDAALDPAAPGPSPGHSQEDCVATLADYSDWRLTTRLIDELVPIKKNRQVKALDFVQWSIIHMAQKGKKVPVTNGTGPCGGYRKRDLLEDYRTANPGAPVIKKSVFNNQQAPSMGILWKIATELVTNTRKRLSGDSGTSPAGTASPPPCRRRQQRAAERGRRQIRGLNADSNSEFTGPEISESDSDTGCRAADSGSNRSIEIRASKRIRGDPQHASHEFNDGVSVQGNPDGSERRRKRSAGVESEVEGGQSNRKRAAEVRSCLLVPTGIFVF